MTGQRLSTLDLAASRNGEVRVRTQLGYIKRSERPVGFVHKTRSGNWQPLDAAGEPLGRLLYSTRYDALKVLVNHLNGGVQR